MITKKINYTDYDGNERTEIAYFNLNESEMLKIEMMTPGTLSGTLKNALEKRDMGALMRCYESLILKSYGEKSADGRSFVKSKALSDAFANTAAYEALFMEFMTDYTGNRLMEFLSGVMSDTLKTKLTNNPDVTNVLNEYADQAAQLGIDPDAVKSVIPMLTRPENKEAAD